MRRSAKLLALLLPALFCGLLAAQEQAERELDAIYVPTPHQVADAMLRLAGVGPDDVVYDLGSGDGRIVIAAARDFGARGVGIDLDPERIRESRENARKAGVEDRVKFIEGDLFEADISDATVVTLYLWAEMNIKLRPRLLRELRPGTVIVAQTFAIGNWRPDKTIEVEGDISRHNVFLWRVPAQVAGEWRWSLGKDQFTLRLGQAFQEVTGTLEVNGHEVAISAAKLEGDRLQFTLPPQGRDGPRHFSGRAQGDTVKGEVRAGGQRQSWTARRIRQLAPSF